ncbi:MAG: DUF2306 domain-containing protein [Pseudomonadota bacterium]
MTTQQPSRTGGYSLQTAILLGGAIVLMTFALMALSRMTGGFVADEKTIAEQQGLNLPIIIHLATVLPAVPLGAWVLWRKKGDALHKILGRIWGMLMITTAISSFWIGEPGTGIAGSGLSFIHLFSVLVLVSVPMGVWALRVGDYAGHQRAMQGMYIGLIVAGLFSFIPGRILGTAVFG